MGMILDESSPPLQGAIPSETPVFRGFKTVIGKFNHFRPASPSGQALLRPMPTRKVSADLSREALGLMGFTTRKFALNISTNWL
jgi:hypothetical protein